MSKNPHRTRNLLPVTHAAAFREWLVSQGYAVRDGSRNDPLQVMQVKSQVTPAWDAIYMRARALKDPDDEHYLTLYTRELNELAVRFLHSEREKTQPSLFGWDGEPS
jgi:hypothetical protein